MKRKPFPGGGYQNGAEHQGQGQSHGAHEDEDKERGHERGAKRQRKRESDNELNESKWKGAQIKSQPYSFEVTDEKDHAETPYRAYADLEPLIYKLCSRLKKTKAEMAIYDPYFCQGSVIRHLNKLGFDHVSNENRDCYADWASKSTPPFDLLITNPPYSSDHMRRAVEYAVKSMRPWCLLMPAFVARKDYFQAAVGSLPMLYLGPEGKPYSFSAPDFLRGSKAFTPASFDCVWFIGLGDHSVPIKSWWDKRSGDKRSQKMGPGLEEEEVGSAVLSETVEGLPRLAMDPQKKRREEDKERRSWRKKLSRQRKQAAKNNGFMYTS